ncbi:MAG TPA: hypothetical protein VGN97_10385 [Mesorhizobium sp.]|jgi:hypothetical protein|nr:hypothetical protein [Mesorhizobium sp.]
MHAPHDTDIDNRHFGRRVEANGSWTVYHVFTGAPADLRDITAAGLSRTEATRLMTSLNAANCTCRPARPIAASLLDRQPEAAFC